MRRLATLGIEADVRRLILYESDGGVFLFGRASGSDGPCDWDLWFSDVRGAEAHCSQAYGLGPEDWQIIPDPLAGCQDDWVAPVRVKGPAEGNPELGTFELLEADGVWREIRSVERSAGRPARMEPRR